MTRVHDQLIRASARSSITSHVERERDSHQAVVDGLRFRLSTNDGDPVHLAAEIERRDYAVRILNRLLDDIRRGVC